MLDWNRNKKLQPGKSVTIFFSTKGKPNPYLEISGNILRNQKNHRFRFIYSKQFKLFESHLDLYESLYDFFAET